MNIKAGEGKKKRVKSTSQACAAHCKNKPRDGLRVRLLVFAGLNADKMGNQRGSVQVAIVEDDHRARVDRLTQEKRVMPL